MRRNRNLLKQWPLKISCRQVHYPSNVDAKLRFKIIVNLKFHVEVVAFFLLPALTSRAVMVLGWLLSLLRLSSNLLTLT